MSLSWTLQKVALHYFFVLGVNVGNEQYFVASQNFPLHHFTKIVKVLTVLGWGYGGGGGVIMRAGDEFEKLEKCRKKMDLYKIGGVGKLV